MQMSLSTAEQNGTPPWFWILLVLIIVVLFVLVLWFGPKFAAKEAEQGKSPAVTEQELEQAPDDLAIIEGIGPKISAALQEAGIKTFTQLAGTEVKRLEEILEQDSRLRLADPTTWPKQAALAAAGDWHALEELQDKLKGGRED